VDAPSAALGRHAEGLCQFGNRGACLGGVELEFAAEKGVGADIAEQHISIGDSRLGTAASVAGRAGNGARAVRSNLKQAEAVARGDGATAGADLDHLDRLNLEREATAAVEALVTGDLKFATDHRLAIRHQAELCGGASHVEGHDACLIDLARIFRRRDRPGRRPRFDQPHRCARRSSARHNAAAGRHPKHPGDDPILAQIGFKPLDMLRH
jgi:hypothetical protein